ncbi:MAG: type I methionyl aminopeptidase [Candidatus Vogelbacteria bacterium RIFOXYD1_FULL_46_19]|uniref:Methionine aminopeptidase n=1 Tax=Candidatus Vogelbacteria bacterium RIFOXYD1_FULL_46_19 TaxID=1802439 RepID=A0A1G2QHD9_9BACT|nr:MAG: type I methionyl aminopeptidase [Candidatus Vogelbacteria bacterium RIFOXYD1_FULL_46_19]
MIRLKNEQEIKILRAGGKRLAGLIERLSEELKPGLKTGELDDLAQELIAEAGDRPAFLNYRPEGAILAYPAALCVSINEEIVHGIPGGRVINDGDLVTLDLGLIHQGLVTDMARSFSIGEPSPEVAKLLMVTREALDIGIAAARPQGTVGDIGAAIEDYVTAAGFGLARDLSGHGVGFAVHEDPQVPNYGRPGEGAKLEPGLVIAIEPMVLAGREKTKLLGDGYTFITADGSLCAHFEHTIAITETGVEILTIK